MAALDTTLTAMEDAACREYGWPTPADIAASTQAIREDWTREDYAKRIGVSLEPYEVPLQSTASFDHRRDVHRE